MIVLFCFCVYCCAPPAFLNIVFVLHGPLKAHIRAHGLASADDQFGGTP